MSKPTGNSTREAGLRRLADFVPRAGVLYEKSRNFDFGPERRGNVSTLSPYVRHRLLLEEEILETVLLNHSASASRKFIEEIFWRAYFKGWLEQHPTVWTDYRRSVSRALQTLQDDAQLLQRYEAAVAGNTGIDCFDAWVQELISDGYLHNHARMWFASIWVFTLGLPWQLGADFFYRHLVDGDPASNTLGWRWVCGLHTQGKTYLARASNIEHFSDKRFSPKGQLAEHAPPLTEESRHRTMRLPAPQSLDTGVRYGLLCTEEDCNPESLAIEHPPVAVLGALATELRSPLPVGEPARSFAEGAVKDAVERAAQIFSVDASVSYADDWSPMLLDWAAKQNVKTIVTAYSPVGPVAESFDDASRKLAEHGIMLLQLRRHYDELTWPHAQRGFFKLRKAIPGILEALDLNPEAEDDRRKAS